MAHDVFISYSSKDKGAADALCAALEGDGLKCWIAPRDTEAGAYGPSIVRAIRATRVFVLLLSEASNASQHVAREVERAVSLKLPIVPFALAPVTLSDDMEYYVASLHRIDGYPGAITQHLPGLIARIRAELAGERPSLLKRRQQSEGPKRHGIGYRIERLMVPLSRLPPPVTALTMILLGMVVNGASLFIGIGSFEYTLTIDGAQVNKEGGFLAALSWLLGCLLIIPALILFGLYTHM